MGTRTGRGRAVGGTWEGVMGTGDGETGQRETTENTPIIVESSTSSSPLLLLLLFVGME